MKYSCIGSTNHRGCLISQDILFEYPIYLRLPSAAINNTEAYVNANLSTYMTTFRIPVIRHATLHIYPGTQLLKKRYILNVENRDFVVELLPKSSVSSWPPLEQYNQWLDDTGVLPNDRHCMVTGVQFMVIIHKKKNNSHEICYEYRVGGKVEII
ncbi:hypothetical protein DOLIC_00125 [Dolichomitus sp. PSUC_FEM 10030005]|nr:hypothetical protein [Dolichomitus sp. PSUC_FEM 10030005]